MNNTLLYSAKELATLRTNKKAQRNLELAHRQMDQERSYVSNDWNQRMRTFITQKKKLMPKDWDYNKHKRPTSSRFAATPITINGTISGEFGAPNLHKKIPDTWQLQGCYTKLADGRIIPRPKTNPPGISVTRSSNLKRTQSAPMGSSRRKGSTRPKSTNCSPNLPRKSSFLVTQLQMEDTLYGPVDDELFEELTDSNSLHPGFEQRPFSALQAISISNRPLSGLNARPRSHIVNHKR